MSGRSDHRATLVGRAYERRFCRHAWVERDTNTGEKRKRGKRAPAEDIQRRARQKRLRECMQRARQRMEQAGKEKVREGTGDDETNRSEEEESDYEMWHEEEEEDRGSDDEEEENAAWGTIWDVIDNG